MPETQRERIFERFVRLESSEVRETKGSGLGLAISRSIIALHQGTIRAEAGAGGVGLRVTFELPIGELTTTHPFPELQPADVGGGRDTLQPD